MSYCNGLACEVRAVSRRDGGKKAVEVDVEDVPSLAGFLGLYLFRGRFGVGESLEFCAKLSFPYQRIVVSLIEYIEQEKWEITCA